MRNLFSILAIGGLLFAFAAATPASACQCCYYEGFPGVCYPKLPCDDWPRCPQSALNTSAKRSHDMIMSKLQRMLRQNGIKADVSNISLSGAGKANVN